LKITWKVLETRWDIKQRKDIQLVGRRPREISLEIENSRIQKEAYKNIV
jgi:hypothetical protein